jgi:hypothetical protein
MKKLSDHQEIHARLSFELHLLRHYVTLFPVIALAVLVWIHAFSEYPVQIFATIKKQIGDVCTSLIHSSITSNYTQASTVRSCLAEKSLWYSNSSVHVYSEDSFIVSPVLGYNLADAKVVNCSDSGTFGIFSMNFRNCSANSKCPRTQLSCVETRRYTKSNSSEYINDSTFGYVPATILGPPTSDDTETSLTSILSLWYSPRHDIFSLVEIRFDSSSLSVVKEMKQASFRRISGDNAFRLRSIVCLSLSCLLLLIDVGNMANKNRSPWTLRQSRFLHRVCPLIASIIMTAVLAYKYYSVTHASWDSILIQLGALKQLSSPRATFDAFNVISHLFYILNIERTATIIVLWLSVFRVVIYLSAHPRMAILAETLRIGWDRLMHFLFVYIMLLLCFSLLYVAVIDDQLTFYRAIIRLSGFIMGNPILSNDSFISVIFGIAFGAVMCITCLYFLLALAVSAYEQYLADIAQTRSIVRPLLTDFKLIITSLLLGLWNRWPSHTVAISLLDPNVENPAGIKPNRFEHMMEWYTSHFPSQTSTVHSKDTQEPPMTKTCRIRHAGIREEIQMIKRTLNLIQNNYTQ